MIPIMKDVRVTPSNHGDVIKSKDHYFSVSPIWEGVDRPCTGGWVVRSIHVNRMVKALKDGVVCGDPKRQVDRNGKSYIEYKCLVSAKQLNADLKRLGY